MPREYLLQQFRAPIRLQIDYERELNPQQHAAVTAPPGPALVIAGAGSGKTRTLTYRVAYLIEQGIAPERILLLTFTNKAAREMMRRVTDLLGQQLDALWGGTFHSIGNRVLRLHGPRMGFGRDFTILDRDDAKHLITTCVRESGVDPKAEGFPKAEVLAEMFSMAFNTRQPLKEILAKEDSSFLDLAEAIGRVQAAYETRKREANEMDFDDLLVLWLKLLEEDEEVREQAQRRFQFILVDEYQDTNRLQSDLIDLLAARHGNVMAVGDDAQSIYAWRGANFRNILEFPKRYPGARVCRIETNYRSTPEILTVANAAIAPNTQQFAKELVPARKSGCKPMLVACSDASEQALFVAHRAQQLREEGVRLGSIAVLYRAHFHALELQLELVRQGVPFSITSGVRFFEQAHVKDVTAFVKLVWNPKDEIAFSRLALLLPGVGARSAEKLRGVYLGRLRELEAKGDKFSLAARSLQACGGSVPRKAAAAWDQFVMTISQLEDEEVRASAARMIRLVLEAGYEDYLEENYTNHRSRLEDLEQLAVFAQQYDTPEAFLAEMALLGDVDGEEARNQDGEDRLRLSTVHQAKGLEFDVVFLIMLCDGLFPSGRSLETIEGEEEERRLFYVAITRARNELYFSYPLIRSGYGGGDDMKSPSRFLSDIPMNLLEEVNLRRW